MIRILMGAEGWHMWWKQSGFGSGGLGWETTDVLSPHFFIPNFPFASSSPVINILNLFQLISQGVRDGIDRSCLFLLELRTTGQGVNTSKKYTLQVLNLSVERGRSLDNTHGTDKKAKINKSRSVKRNALSCCPERNILLQISEGERMMGTGALVQEDVVTGQRRGMKEKRWVTYHCVLSLPIRGLESRRSPPASIRVEPAQIIWLDSGSRMNGPPARSQSGPGCREQPVRLAKK
ncbi:hypothetical protein K438DRAFT_1765985 [Mycena galopus ATCC 62051]|nr:hypothetical protein K438DRAFT_1765985 [Mycena galopus ATCC 62051]